MPRYSVEIEAFGRVRVANIEAASEAEALSEAQAQVGYSAKVAQQPGDDAGGDN